MGLSNLQQVILPLWQRPPARRAYASERGPREILLRLLLPEDHRITFSLRPPFLFPPVPDAEKCVRIQDTAKTLLSLDQI